MGSGEARNAMVMGLLPAALAIQDDVDGFCVSNIDEAIELRLAGQQKISFRFLS